MNLFSYATGTYAHYRMFRISIFVVNALIERLKFHVNVCVGAVKFDCCFIAVFVAEWFRYGSKDVPSPTLGGSNRTMFRAIYRRIFLSLIY